MKLRKSILLPPYLIFYPEGLKTKHAIESLSVYLLKKNLLFYIIGVLIY